MKKDYNTELDYILEELIKVYEYANEGVKFYSGQTPKTTKEEITQKAMVKFGLKEWELNVLLHHLLIDKYIISVEPLYISLDGLIFSLEGGYVLRKTNQDAENIRVQKIEDDVRKNSYGLMVFTAILAFGTLISAYYFVLEIWKYYQHPPFP
jgi:hypothetical protein